MAARKPKALPANASLVDRVLETASAYKLGPEHSARLGLALMLARSLDEMPAEMRQRMAAQTAGALLHTLTALTERTVLVSSTLPGKWGEMAPGAVASRRLGAGRY